MTKEFKRMQELAGVKLQENYELEEAAAENLELKSLQKKAYSALKGMGFDSKITSGEAGAGKTILSKQTYKDNRGVALVNLDPETGIFDVLVTSDSLKRDKDNKNQNLDPDQEANKVVDELEKLIDRNKFEVGYKQTNDRGGSIYQIFVRAKSTGKKGGVMATEALNEVYVAGGMTKEQLRMQMLAGILTEGEYKSQLNENKFEMVGSDVEGVLDAISLINGKNIAKLKPLDTTGHQITDDKFSIEVEIDLSEFIQNINSYLEESGYQTRLYKTN
jgi:hypothetical protein